MTTQPTDLLQGTLDLMVLKVLTWGPRHGYAIARLIEERTGETLRVEEGSLYPALYRMEDKAWIEAEWRMTENSRRAKYYSLTRAGRKQLETEQAEWQRMTSIIAQVMQSA